MRNEPVVGEGGMGVSGLVTIVCCPFTKPPLCLPRQEIAAQARSPSSNFLVHCSANKPQTLVGRIGKKAQTLKDNFFEVVQKNSILLDSYDALSEGFEDSERAKKKGEFQMWNSPSSELVARISQQLEFQEFAKARVGLQGRPVPRRITCRSRPCRPFHPFHPFHPCRPYQAFLLRRFPSWAFQKSLRLSSATGWKQSLRSGVRSGSP